MSVNVLLFTGSFYSHMRTAGAYRIATQLRRSGYTVQVVDCLPQIVAYNDETLRVLIEKFVGEDTLWVGFSSTFLFNVRESKAALKRGLSSRKVDDNKLMFAGSILPFPQEEQERMRDQILALNPKCKIVIGGARTHLRNCLVADVYIDGYADMKVVEFTRWLDGKNPFLRWESCGPGGRQMALTSSPDADGLDFTSTPIEWHESDHIAVHESLPIEIARGCIFSCSFCSYPLNGKKKLDYIRHADSLVEELTRNYDLFGTTQYVYADDTHNDSMHKLEYLYENVYSRLPFKIGFYTYLRLDLLAAHPDSIPLLKESGLRGAFFGIESLNYESAKAIGKGIRPERALETLDRVRETWGSDVKTSAGFIVGLPHETPETVSWLGTITQPSFPLDCVHIYPLYISKSTSKFWKSDLEKDPESFGYSFDQNGDWYNRHWAFKDCKSLADHFLDIAAHNGKRKMSDFSLPALMNLGYTQNELDVQINGLEQTGAAQRSILRITNYVNKLLLL